MDGAGKSRRRVAAVAGVLVLVTAFLLWGTGVLDGSAAPAPEQGDPPAAAVPITGALARPDADPDAPAAAPVDAAAATTTERSELAAADAFVLVVRRRTDRQPMPGAEVRFGIADPVATARVSPRLDQVAFRDLEVELIQPRTVRADARGTVHLPIDGPREWTVAARAGDLYGHDTFAAWQNDEPGERTLWLDADHELVVEVRQADGTLVEGVPVALGWQGDFRSMRDQPQQVVAARTDATGRARIAHLQRPSLFGDRPVGEVFVTLGEPGFTGPGVRVDLRQVPREPVVLWLPPTGRVVVELDPVLRFPGAEVQLLPAGDDPTWAHYWRLLAPPDGRVVFPRVALGKRFHVLGSFSWVPANTEVVGPTQPGQEVVVALAPNGLALALRGRALQDGVPLAGRELVFVLAGDRLKWIDRHGNEHGERSARFEVTTDTDGRFAHALPGRWAGSALQQARVAYRDADNRVLLFAELGWDTVPPGPVIDLGDVAFAPPPVLARGELVYDDGTPCPGCILWCRLVGAGPMPAGVQDWLVAVDGARFTVRGPHRDGEFEIFGRTRRGGVIAPVTCRAGAEDLRIVVSRGGTLHASVLAPGPIERHDVDLLLLEPGTNTPVQVAPPRRGGDRTEPRRMLARWGDLPPGRYDVVVRWWSQPATDVRIGNVVVAAGEETRDPRLQDLALTGRRVHIEAVDADTSEPAGPWGAVILHRPAEGPLLGVSFYLGRGELFVQGAPEVQVAVQGYLPATARLDGDVLRVALQSSRRALRLSLGDAPELPAGTSVVLRAEPVLTQDEERRLHTDEWRGPLAELLGRMPAALDFRDGRAEGSLVAGRWRLSVTLARGGRTVEVGDIAPAELDLQSDAALTLRATVTAWQRALAELGR